MRYYFLLLTLILCLSVTHAHVIGIDFGSQYLKVAGPHSDQLMDIVLNELSKRKIDNYIGFRNGDRYIGEPAKVLAARFPLMTAAAVNQLLVLASNSTSLPQFLASKFEYAVDISDSRTHVPIGERFAPFSAVQLYSMFLSYAQKIARNDGVLDPQSVVVTVPYNTGSIERKVILDAATRYSGLNVLGLVHAPTAAAFYYGMRRRGFGNRTVTITVLDVGYTQTSAGVYRFTPAKNNSPMTNAFGTLTTIATSSDAFVGGRALDLCVAEFIEKKAMKEMNIGPVIGGKTAVQLKSQFSLLRAANKVREVLSVNSNTPYTVEGIVPERDFHSTITREVFEKECSGIFDRITKVAEEALQVSGMKPADLDAFELMGGTARTPKIISSISKALGREVDRTMNMEEAAAIGAGYIAAKLSPHYRAKSFQLQERLSDDIYFTVHPPVDSTKEGVKRNLFDTSNFIGRTVSVTLNRTDDFSLHLFEEPNAVTPFASIDVSGVRAALEKLKVFQPEIPHPNNSHIIRIQLSVNESELIEVSEVEAIARSAVNVTRKAPSNVNASNGTGETHYIRMRNANRPLKSSIVWWNAVVSSDVQQKELDDLRAIDAIELEKHLRSDAKNSLEAYLFWCRNEGIVENEELIAVVSSEEMDQFKTVLGEVSEWLDDGEGESDSCPTSLYKEKLQLLQQWAKKLKAAKTAQKGVEKGENSSDEDL